jgi:hypothetical protein
MNRSLSLVLQQLKRVKQYGGCEILYGLFVFFFGLAAATDFPISRYRWQVTSDLISPCRIAIRPNW